MPERVPSSLAFALLELSAGVAFYVGGVGWPSLLLMFVGGMNLQEWIGPRRASALPFSKTVILLGLSIFVASAAISYAVSR